MVYKTDVKLQPGTKIKRFRPNGGGVIMDQECLKSMVSSMRLRLLNLLRLVKRSIGSARKHGKTCCPKFRVERNSFEGRLNLGLITC